MKLGWAGVAVGVVVVSHIGVWSNSAVAAPEGEDLPNITVVSKKKSRRGLIRRAGRHGLRRLPLPRHRPIQQHPQRTLQTAAERRASVRGRSRL